MPAARGSKPSSTAASEAVVEGLLLVAERLAERVERLEAAVGQLAAINAGVAGGAQTSIRMPELGALLAEHERSGRHPRIG